MTGTILLWAVGLLSVYCVLTSVACLHAAKKVRVATSDAPLRKAYADIKIVAERERRGWVCDPGGAPMCTVCGRGVWATEKRCARCNNRLSWGT